MEKRYRKGAYLGNKGDEFSFGHVEFKVRYRNVDAQEIVKYTKFIHILVDFVIDEICAIPSYWACP